MKRFFRTGLIAVTVCGALILSACATDGYYGSGYSTAYPSYYGYPSSSISLYYSSPRYYRYRYHPHYRHHYRHRHYRHHYRHHGRPYYRYRGGYRGHHGYHSRPGRGVHRPRR